jgi:hypothetical protein
MNWRLNFVVWIKIFCFNLLSSITLGDKNTATSYFEYLMELFILLIDRGCSEQLSQVRGFLNNVPMHSDSAAAA